jgi:hypothetical protein
MIERIDLGDDAERLPPREVEMSVAGRERLALDFGHKAGAIAQPIRGPGHVAAHADDGVAGVDCIDERQCVGVFLDAIGKTLKTTRPLFDRQTRPIRESPLGGPDGRIDVHRAGGWNVRELVHVRWINRSE